MANVVEGFTLMIIGMTTVFVILGILIVLTEGLIWLVNKYAPEEQMAQEKKHTRVEKIDELTMEILRQTVNQITHGKGSVSKVEKL